MGEKPFCIWFDKMDGFIKIYNGIKYLALLEYNESFDWIKYLISEKIILQIVLVIILQESELVYSTLIPPSSCHRLF